MSKVIKSISNLIPIIFSIGGIVAITQHNMILMREMQATQWILMNKKRKKAFKQWLKRQEFGGLPTTR